MSLSPARGEERALGGKHLVQPRSEGEDIRPWIKELKTAVAERVISAEIRAAIGASKLLNRGNVAQINPIFGVGTTPIPSFGQPITGTRARRIQFSLDFEF